MADKTPKTLSGIEETVKVDGKDTKLTVVTTYTPEKNDADKVIKTLRDLLKLKIVMEMFYLNITERLINLLLPPTHRMI